MDYIVTRAFQHRGGIWRAGQTIRLDEAELSDPFVASHVRPRAEGDRPPERPYFGNGVEKARPETPAKAARAAKDGSAKELRAALAKMGVPCPPNATKEDLAVLLAQAKEAVAGSPEEPNAPELGI